MFPCRLKLTIRIIAALHQCRIWPPKRQRPGVLAVAVCIGDSQSRCLCWQQSGGNASPAPVILCDLFIR